MNIKPISDRILVKPAEEENMTKGGIIIPDTVAKEKPMEGEIVEVGAGRITEEGKLIDMVLKKGDQVLFNKYTGNEITIDGVDYIFMRESEIFAVVSK